MRFFASPETDKIVRFSGKKISTLKTEDKLRTKMLVCLSVRGNVHCTGTELKAIVKESIKNHKKVTFLIGDEPQWHNLKQKTNTEEEIVDYKNQALKMGSDYLAENLSAFLEPLFPHITEDEFYKEHIDKTVSEQIEIINELAAKHDMHFEIIRWREWVENPKHTYSQYQAELTELYGDNGIKGLQGKLKEAVTTFVKRHKNQAVIQDNNLRSATPLALLRQNSLSSTGLVRLVSYDCLLQDTAINASPLMSNRKSSTPKLDLVRLPSHDRQSIMSSRSGTPFSSKNNKKYDQNKLDLIKLRSKDYLLEETPAIFWIAATLKYEFVAYPGKKLPLFEETRRQLLVAHQDNMPTTQPWMVKVKDPEKMINWVEISIKQTKESKDSSLFVSPDTGTPSRTNDILIPENELQQEIKLLSNSPSDVVLRVLDELREYSKEERNTFVMEIISRLANHVLSEKSTTYSDEGRFRR
jgi:hypothetical protein